MRCDPPLAHGAVLDGLWRAAQAGRLPHALLFEGPSGVGKFLTARRLAMGLFCSRGPGDPCGACGPCKRFLSGAERANHPDLHVVDAEAEGEERIKVERIAQRDGGEESVESFLGLRAMEGGWRVVLIRDSEGMNQAAQNALLKTLEEPGPDTLLILITSRAERLLDTIRSRCVRMRFGRLTREETARVVRGAGLEEDEAKLFARLCAGSPGDALTLAARGGASLQGLLGDVVRGRIDPLDAARAVFEVDGEFLGATPRARERDRARTLFRLALEIAADARRHAAGIPAAELANGEFLDSDVIERLDREAADQLLRARADVDLNLTPQAVVERSLLVLAGGARVLSNHG